MTIRARSPMTILLPHADSKLSSGICRSRQVTRPRYHGGVSRSKALDW